MGAKDTMKMFFASMNEQSVPTRGYGPKIVSTPMGPFSFNDTLGVWVNANNGMQMPNIAFQDMYAMMDYNSIGGSSNETPATPVTPIPSINTLNFSPSTQNISNIAGNVAATPTFTISGNNVPVSLSWFSNVTSPYFMGASVSFRKNGGDLTSWSPLTSTDPVTFSAGDTLQIFIDASAVLSSTSAQFQIKNITDSNTTCSNRFNVNVVAEG